LYEFKVFSRSSVGRFTHVASFPEVVVYFKCVTGALLDSAVEILDIGKEYTECTRHRAKSTKSPNLPTRYQRGEDGCLVPEVKS
jgi:hypothetical protein